MCIHTICSMCLVKSNQFQILRSYMLLLHLPILTCSCLVPMFSIHPRYWDMADGLIRQQYSAIDALVLVFLVLVFLSPILCYIAFSGSGSPLASHAGSSTCTQRTGRRFVCQRDQEKWSPSLQSCVIARTGSQGVDTRVGSLHSNHDKLWKGPGNRRELIKLLHSLHLVV